MDKLINVSYLQKDLDLEADFVVVGSGAGGGTSAEILAKAGYKVIIVEEGNYETSKDFDLKELSTFNRLYFEGATRPTKDRAFTVVQGRTVGGSTVVNWTTCIKTPKETLEYWENDLGIQGYSSKELEPWFEVASKRLSIHTWEAHNQNNNLLSLGAKKLGWRYSSIPRNVKNCHMLGYCGLGCPVDAKQSQLVTTIPSALKEKTTLLYNTKAVRYEWKDNRIDHLNCIPANVHGIKTPTIRLFAKYFITSAGAINSPALLLRSKLPDPYQLIGKRTFVQLHNYSVAEMPSSVFGFFGAPQSVASDEFLWKDGVTGRAGYNIEAVGAQPIVLMNLRKLVGDEFEAYVKSYPNLHVLVSQIRDGFNEESQGGTVSLNDVGYPILDYPLNDYIIDGIRRSYLSMAECQFAAGAKTVVPANNAVSPYSSWMDAKKGIESMTIQSPNTVVNSTHPLGGNPMGKDPKTSVVDTSGKFHHLKNLSVIDGSIFPTSLGVNPSFTIYSIASKLANQLAREII
ncbi:GMC family oxidoreductase [Leptospira meyeri]|uniref:GMC family oxidoreductase n=1 Tax=Leptospira meyeri TaxID=29508 RepID=UPI000C2A1B16|nr:GMC family oxidoreductase [Leptospira meyeri]MCW7488490.1 GMC family oxidoreductase [Leptospira meyeri]PJZ81341.1 flavoprotein [Leptospira meyeri]PJZ96845.1 flavoprotein [Leptospira meyeri]TGL15059.1 GMC family oxidoreductase [Leptospira meyeri]TGM64137.1 GMC family oxidoreductase [Leptospira meyeri]